MIRRAIVASVLAGATFVAACSSGNKTAAPAVKAELGTFPYNPLVYHLDLSILAYQIHGQSLVWPFDPYYEERAEPLSTTRSDFMARVRNWALALPNSAALDGYRGPGVGLQQNPAHDPIVYNYSRIHPWSSCIMNADGRWTEYLTPTRITNRIKEVYVGYRYQPTGGANEVRVAAVPARALPRDRDPDASDYLLAFEGGTGDKGEANMPPSQSLMGVVLARTTGNATYDLHIAFRGSRSGLATRAFFEALSTDNPSGNPDWITDLGFAEAPEPTRSAITTVGKVARGFATSIRSINPQLFACLQQVQALKGTSPTNIYVTGHSLGGALAQHFGSAVLLGSEYGPDGAGVAMPNELRTWPWRSLKLITYGAPRAGDEAWARRLTIDKLQSTFYDGGILPTFDGDALESSDGSIAPRLLDANRPAGFRVLISTDPITNAIPGDNGQPVGQTIYVNKINGSSVFGLPDTADHEPEAIRDLILQGQADDRTPTIAWMYEPLSSFPPERGDAERGKTLGFQKLRDAVINYYNSRGLWFDVAGFEGDFQRLLTIP